MPWVPLACLAVAVIAALLFKRFAPASAQKPTSPVLWVFIVLATVMFGGAAVAFSSP